MSGDTYKPTSANILASLGVRGASLRGGASAAGKIPVVGESGTIDLSFLPIDEISAEIDIPSLKNTAFVEKNAGINDPSYVPNGSIVFPFPTLDAAAADNRAFSNFVIVSGDYLVSNPNFKTRSTVIRLFSTGAASFSNLTLSGYQGSTTFVLNNISVSGTLFPEENVSCSVILSGEGTVTTLKGAVNNDSDPISSPYYLSSVQIGPDFRVLSTSLVSSDAITYLATSAQVTNASATVPGKTVKDATDRLGLRKVRIPTFTASRDGIHASGQEDVPAEDDSSDSCSDEVHDIRRIGTTLAQAANETFYKEGDSPNFTSVQATSVTTGLVQAMGVSTVSVKFGNVPVYVDADGFLTVGELDSSDSCAYPYVDNADVTMFPLPVPYDSSSDSESSDDSSSF